MRELIIAFSLLLFHAAQVLAAGLGTPQISGMLDLPGQTPPAASARFFDTDRFLTNAGMVISAAPELTLEPELGIGYRGKDQELHGGIEQSTHRLHAQAGWRLSLSESLYLSAAAKFSMVTVATKGLAGGEELGGRLEPGSRTGYDFALGRAPRWTGEVGVRLSPRTDLMLYYDQDPLTGWSPTGQHQEERVGTRFIFRFK